MIKRVLAGAMFALAIGAVIERAKADQVFVCDDGKTITVSASGLEDAKRFDPCVAKYFGGVAGVREVPLPERRPVTLAATGSSTASVPGMSRTTRPAVEVSTASAESEFTTKDGDEPVGTARTGPDSPRIVAFRPAVGPTEQSMSDRLAQLEAGDFRRVRVINANGNDTWFDHGR